MTGQLHTVTVTHWQGSLRLEEGVASWPRLSAVSEPIDIGVSVQIRTFK